MTFSRWLASSSLSKHDTWIAYFAVFILAMIYTFAITHHSTVTLRKIPSAPTRSTLMKLGFNRNTALAVAHGPARYTAPSDYGTSLSNRASPASRYLFGTSGPGPPKARSS
jgi:hypothetical protein